MIIPVILDIQDDGTKNVMIKCVYGYKLRVRREIKSDFNLTYYFLAKSIEDIFYTKVCRLVSGMTWLSFRTYSSDALYID